jgi:hypothetical protein
MFKKYSNKFSVYIILIAFPSLNLFSQVNLVPNPSFEDTVSCPDGLDQLINVVGWYSAGGSPDYFNSCANASSPVSVPENIFGFQSPKFGNAYTGFWAKAASFMYREYIGIQLNSNLQLGQKYFITLNLCLSTNPTSIDFCGVNKIGVLFSTANFISSPLNNYCHFYSDSIITDTSNWITIKGSFIADSLYLYMYMGNFFHDTLIDSIQITGTECLAYYFLDDVCVSLDSTICDLYVSSKILENPHVKSFAIFHNPVSDVLTIESNQYTILNRISIYDMFGALLYIKNDFISSIEHIPISNINSGLYIVQVEYGNKIFNYKILKK